MKKFSHMNQSEIDKLSDEDFRAISPFEKKSCADCKSLGGYVTLWCFNEKAISDRGTRIPGGVKCPHWTPDWKHIDNKYKTPENKYPFGDGTKGASCFPILILIVVFIIISVIIVF